MARKKHSGLEQFKVRLGAVVCSDSFFLCDCGVFGKSIAIFPIQLWVSTLLSFFQGL